MAINPAFILLFTLPFTLPVQAEIDEWFGTDEVPLSSSEPANPVSGENRNDLKAKTDDQNQAAPQVDLYVTSWCPYCKKAIAFLHKNNIAFNEYDIEEDLDAAKRKETLAPDYAGIPLAVINGIIIPGFNEGRYQKALKEKRHGSVKVWQ